MFSRYADELVAFIIAPKVGFIRIVLQRAFWTPGSKKPEDRGLDF